MAQVGATPPVNTATTTPDDTTGSVSALKQQIADLKAQNDPTLEASIRKLGSEYYYLQQRAYPNDKPIYLSHLLRNRTADGYADLWNLALDQTTINTSYTYVNQSSVVGCSAFN